jgi:hypothetical protein
MKQPRIKASLICDEAIKDANGKVSLIGLFENINSSRFPAQHPRFAVFNRWGGGLGKFTLQIRLLDPNKKKVVDESRPQEVDFPDEQHLHNDIFYLVNALFENPGTYWIESLLDGIPVHYEPLSISKV